MTLQPTPPTPIIDIRFSDIFCEVKTHLTLFINDAKVKKILMFQDLVVYRIFVEIKVVTFISNIINYKMELVRMGDF